MLTRKMTLFHTAAVVGFMHAVSADGGGVAEAAAPQPQVPVDPNVVAKAAEVAAEIKPTLPPSPIAGTVLRSKKYFFKKDDLGVKRPTVELALPYPTKDTIVAMFQDEKQTAILMDLVNSLIEQHAREQVGDEKNPVNKQEELDLSKLTIDFISKIPPGERRGGGIAKETWETFYTDYVEVMVAATGKAKENVENAGKIFLARLQPVKTQKKILAFLEQQLAHWFTSSQQQEELGEVYEFLTEKIKALLAADEAALLANL